MGGNGMGIKIPFPRQPDFPSPHNIFSVTTLFLTYPNYEMYPLMYYIWGNTL